MIIFATMVQLNNDKEWFATWFNSPYYHILYKNRDDEEARKFIELLSNYLNLPKESKLLDLACGAGRHARVFHELGFNVSGCDLSENSIKEAIEDSPKDIHFFVHDMRNDLPEKYDAIFNMFTSFGYFDDVCENMKVLRSTFKALNPNGKLIIDFMNCTKIIRDLKPVYELTIEDIYFHIRKEVRDGKILKTISFEDNGESHVYQEKVQVLYPSDFSELLKEAGFEIQAMFGNYQLSPFDENQSDRLILICHKA